jgi:hypothetical protein
MTFLVTSKTENSLLLFYKEDGKITKTDLLFDKEKNEWSVKFQNEIKTEKNLKDLIAKIFTVQ